MYAEGQYLDYILAEIGLDREPAVAAKRRITVEADAGVVIPAGYKVSTVVLDGGGNPVEFTADAKVAYAISGPKSVAITCTQAGVIGNVPVGSQFMLIPPIPGVRVITDDAITLPGEDIESDESAYARYDYKVRHPDTGGNKHDYVRWVEALNVVGKVRVLPRWNGNGTVKLVLVGTDFAPATPSVVSVVQKAIDPILAATVEAESFTAGGLGVTVDNSLLDDTQGSLKMVYDAGGPGYATYAPVDHLLETENHFKARVKVKVDSSAGATDLFKITVRDNGTKVAIKQTKGGSLDATAIYKASQLTATFGHIELPFYYNGDQALEIEVRRLTTDTTTVVYVDQVDVVSVYGQGLGYGKAPGGARVFVKAADALTLSIAATSLTLAAGVTKPEVLAAFTLAVNDYIKAIVFDEAVTAVAYAKIGGLLIATAGVLNYSGLTVNGGIADIVIGTEQAPVLGAITL
ncbi:baseplate J/gp47 family protein [Pelosinus fermentans]|nr:baseplate J/gp47 family protein [Pelosinus fermentans]